MAITLWKHDYQIVHKRGSSNTYADELSTIHVAETTLTPTVQEKLKIFQEMHMKPTGGHLGIQYEPVESPYSYQKPSKTRSKRKTP